MPPTETSPDPRPYYLGLMSGTSVDGIDAALVRFTDESQPEVLAARSVDFEPELRREILELSQSDASVRVGRIARLDHRIGAAFAQAALDLIERSGIPPARIGAIGSHGQTLHHAPSGTAPCTWQLGDPNLIAERTGITTVADFRRRDVAAGGQGAPLMPAFHRALLGTADADIAVLNLGGIANLSLLPRHGGVTGFDTGPANGLMDAWILARHGERFDRDGRLARSGRVDAGLLQALLADPFFALSPPKSTGRDHFNLAWLHRHPGIDQLDAADVQATLLELTVRSIARALQAQLPGVTRLLVCGGGARNPALMQGLSRQLPKARVESTAAVGIDPDFVEAIGFAWLARRTLHGLNGNLPEVTGARGERILGAIHPA